LSRLVEIILKSIKEEKKIGGEIISRYTMEREDVQKEIFYYRD
jgi:hypothetical protein